MQDTTTSTSASPATTGRPIYRTRTVRAYTCEAAPQPHLIRIDRDGSVRVWDAVAGHYTLCHILSEEAAQ